MTELLAAVNYFDWVAVPLLTVVLVFILLAVVWPRRKGDAVAVMCRSAARAMQMLEKSPCRTKKEIKKLRRYIKTAAVCGAELSGGDYYELDKVAGIYKKAHDILDAIIITEPDQNKTDKYIAAVKDELLQAVKLLTALHIVDSEDEFAEKTKEMFSIKYRRSKAQKILDDIDK